MCSAARCRRVLLQVYSPLELLLFIAGCCTIADSFVPQLVNVPKATVNQVVRAVLSMSFVTGASVVVYNLKSRFCKEQAWNVSGTWGVVLDGRGRGRGWGCCAQHELCDGHVSGGVQLEVAFLQGASLERWCGLHRVGRRRCQHSQGMYL